MNSACVYYFDSGLYYLTCLACNLNYFRGNSRGQCSYLWISLSLFLYWHGSSWLWRLRSSNLNYLLDLQRRKTDSLLEFFIGFLMHLLSDRLIQSLGCANITDNLRGIKRPKILPGNYCGPAYFTVIESFFLVVSIEVKRHLLNHAIFVNRENSIVSFWHVRQ